MQSMRRWGFPSVKTCNWAIWHQNAKAEEKTLSCPLAWGSAIPSATHGAVALPILSQNTRFLVWHSWRPLLLFSCKGPLNAATVVGQALEKCVTSVETRKLWDASCLWYWWISVEMYFSSQAVIPFTVKRKERCCKCFMSRESMVPVSSDVFFILLY